MATCTLRRIGWITTALCLVYKPVGICSQQVDTRSVDWSYARTYDYDATVTRAIALLPRRPLEVVVIDTDLVAPALRQKVEHVAAFVMEGQSVVCLRMKGSILQRAQRRGGIFDYALAAIIWHEMAHIGGDDERGAQRQEAALWRTFIVQSRVDYDGALHYLSLLERRREPPEGRSHETTGFLTNSVCSATLRFALERAVRGALHRLEQPECAKVLSEFRDASGHTIQERLDRLNETPRGYVTRLTFHEANDRRCGDSVTLAFTDVGSRDVFICGARFRQAFDTSPSSAEAVVIHEMMHTLGLGENPPSSLEIQAQVLRRCR